MLSKAKHLWGNIFQADILQRFFARKFFGKPGFVSALRMTVILFMRSRFCVSKVKNKTPAFPRYLSKI